MTDTRDHPDIEELVRRLDADLTEEAEEAQWELTRLGRDADVIAPLLRALPTLNSFGQLCAIEIIQELADDRAAGPLIDLLASEDGIVREWAALALAELRVVEAVPALRRAHQAGKDRGIDPGWSERDSIRSALTDLGGRQPVEPPLTASLKITTPHGNPAWPSTRLADVLDDLAAHSQATLYFQLWRLEPDGQLYGMELPPGDSELDYAQPWPALVRQSHRRASALADRSTVGEGIVATIEWINEDDL